MGLFGTPSDDARLNRIERTLDHIVEHLGIEVTSGFSPQVRDAIARGRKIEAIKYYREETGVGLKEAKEIIEAEF